MIDKIYEVIADKTLSEWCILWKVRWNLDLSRRKIHASEDWDLRTVYLTYSWTIHKVYSESQVEEIIWHPVMIGDMLDWMEEDERRFYEEDSVLNLRKEKRKPIEEQSEECISFIYNLVNDK